MEVNEVQVPPLPEEVSLDGTGEARGEELEFGAVDDEAAPIFLKRWMALVVVRTWNCLTKLVKIISLMPGMMVQLQHSRLETASEHLMNWKRS